MTFFDASGQILRFVRSLSNATEYCWKQFNAFLLSRSENRRVEYDEVTNTSQIFMESNSLLYCIDSNSHVQNRIRLVRLNLGMWCRTVRNDEIYNYLSACSITNRNFTVTVFRCQGYIKPLYIISRFVILFQFNGDDSHYINISDSIESSYGHFPVVW